MNPTSTAGPSNPVFPQHVFAIDLSLTNTGIAYDSHEVGEMVSGSIATGPGVDAFGRSGDDVDRMISICETIHGLHFRGLAQNYDFWLEEGFSMATHGKTGSQVAELRGMLRRQIDPNRFTEVPALVLKRFATGVGHAQKTDVVEAVEMWGYVVPTMTPKSKKKNDNVADAIVLYHFAKACRGSGTHGDIAYAQKWFAKQAEEAAA